jgi:hypothetical protein
MNKYLFMKNLKFSKKSKSVGQEPRPKLEKYNNWNEKFTKGKKTKDLNCQRKWNY